MAKEAVLKVSVACAALGLQGFDIDVIWPSTAGRKPTGAGDVAGKQRLLQMAVARWVSMAYPADPSIFLGRSLKFQGTWVAREATDLGTVTVACVPTVFSEAASPLQVQVHVHVHVQ